MGAIYRVEVTRIQSAVVFVEIPDGQDFKGRAVSSVYTEDDVISFAGNRLDFDSSDYESDWSDPMTTEELEDDEEFYGDTVKLPLKQVKPRV